MSLLILYRKLNLISGEYARFLMLLGRLIVRMQKFHAQEVKNAELFRNRKGFFSLNVQAVSGPNLEIQNIVVRWPGSVHDCIVYVVS